MTAIALIIAALLTADLVLVGTVVGRMLSDGVKNASLTEVAPLFVGVGILVAIFTFVITLRRNASADLLAASIDLLERAHNVFTANGTASVPLGTRHVWLSVARMIRTSERLGKKITDKAHRSIYEVKREFWRTRFHSLIWPSEEGLAQQYYALEPSHMRGWSGKIAREPLEEKSLAVLYRFVEWPADVPDPIANEPKFSDGEIHKMRTFGPRNLGNLMYEVNALRQPTEATRTVIGDNAR